MEAEPHQLQVRYCLPGSQSTHVKARKRGCNGSTYEVHFNVECDSFQDHRTRIPAPDSWPMLIAIHFGSF
jgi:hypothetical protein